MNADGFGNGFQVKGKVVVKLCVTFEFMAGETHEKVLKLREYGLRVLVAHLQFLADLIVEVLEKFAASLSHGLVDFEVEFELELVELRDTLLKLAPSYKPNHDDGVQITAAPLWPLFRHKPWQKVLKETWGKLEKGDYDWAHLATNYWPDRVREKCKTDKSLAIAHGLEDLYIEPEAQAKKVRGRKAKEA